MDSFVSDENINTPYWMVRKAGVLLAFFGGLRKTEAEALKLEDIISSSDGVHVTHSRAKQRSDQLCSKFLIPRCKIGVNYAQILEDYLLAIKEGLGIKTGRVFYTGNNTKFVRTLMGHNFLGNVPKEMAERLGLDNSKSYTFHSYRR